MLSGSSMTSIIAHSKRMGLTAPNVLNTMIMETLPLVAFKNHGITAATVNNVAFWFWQKWQRPRMSCTDTWCLDATCLSMALGP